MSRRFLVRTERGPVLVRVNEEADGLAPDFLILERPTDDNAGDLRNETPLRAFGAKMVELIEASEPDVPGGERMRRLMVQEKASADLNRIERWAREHGES